MIMRVENNRGKILYVNAGLIKSARESPKYPGTTIFAFSDKVESSRENLDVFAQRWQEAIEKNG